MSWEEGLTTTVEWFKTHSGRFGIIEDALVAHPRIGIARLPSVIMSIPIGTPTKGF
jgi:hypothetical protein